MNPVGRLFKAEAKRRQLQAKSLIRKLSTELPEMGLDRNGNVEMSTETKEKDLIEMRRIKREEQEDPPLNVMKTKLLVKKQKEEENEGILDLKAETMSIEGMEKQEDLETDLFEEKIIEEWGEEEEPGLFRTNRDRLGQQQETCLTLSFPRLLQSLSLLLQQMTSLTQSTPGVTRLLIQMPNQLLYPLLR